MRRSGLSLKWLEAFEAVARTGSVREAAERLRLSISTVSHHLACLEDEMGLPLLDHGKRPLRMTQAGTILLRHVETSLGSLRKAMSEVWSENLDAFAGTLRIASIEDFDPHVNPALAARLGALFPASSISFLSRPSHDVISLLQSEDADIGIASRADGETPDLVERRLLRDPYLVVLPCGQTASVRDCLSGQMDLPFLRYSKRHIMGRCVEAQLRRLNIVIPSRFEFESTVAILSLVARGHAWTITTALNLATMQSGLGRLRAHPLPEAGFAREISLYQRGDMHVRFLDAMEAALRPEVQTMIVDPMIDRDPALRPMFHLLET